MRFSSVLTGACAGLVFLLGQSAFAHETENGSANYKSSIQLICQSGKLYRTDGTLVKFEDGKAVVFSSSAVCSSSHSKSYFCQGGVLYDINGRAPRKEDGSKFAFVSSVQCIEALAGYAPKKQ